MSIELKDTLPEIDINTKVDIEQILDITYLDITLSDNKIINDMLDYSIEQLKTLPLNYYYSVILCYLYYKYSSNDNVFLSNILSNKSLNFNIKYLDFIYFISVCIYISFIYNDDIDTINKYCENVAESKDFDNEQSKQEYINKLKNDWKEDGVFHINNDNFNMYLNYDKEFNEFFKNKISENNIVKVYENYQKEHPKSINILTDQLKNNLTNNYTNYHNDNPNIDDIIIYTFNNDKNNYYKKILSSYIWQREYNNRENQRIIHIFNVKDDAINSFTIDGIDTQKKAYSYFKDYYIHMIIILSSYISNNINNLNYDKLICIFDHLKIEYKSYKKNNNYKNIINSLNNICNKQNGGKYNKLFL